MPLINKKEANGSAEPQRAFTTKHTLWAVILVQAFCIAGLARWLMQAWNTPERYPREGLDNPFLTYFDGVHYGKGVWKWLHYFPAYERHLGKFRGRDDVHIAEVGIYSGGSLQMWQKVFGPGAMLYGIDIAPSTRVFETDDTTNHTRIFIGDQGNVTFWNDFVQKVPKLDVLIDDGGHSLEQMMVTMENIINHLRPGGVYITEDITGAKNEFLQKSLQYFEELHYDGPKDEEGKIVTSRMQDLIDSVHYYPWLLVVERRETPRGYLQAPRHGTIWNPNAMVAGTPGGLVRYR